MAQLVERILGKDEVPSSTLGSSSKEGLPYFGITVNKKRGLLKSPLLLLLSGVNG